MSSSKCAACSEPMVSARENYSYASSGLPLVTLVEVEVRRCGACGAHEVTIPRAEQLHDVLAAAVIDKRVRLTPPEIRFLRKHLGWSGADFAAHMGVTAESVSRWENAREPMGPVADRLLRLMVAVALSATDYTLERLRELGDAPAALRLRAEYTKGAWRAQMA